MSGVFSSNNQRTARSTAASSSNESVVDLKFSLANVLKTTSEFSGRTFPDQYYRRWS